MTTTKDPRELGEPRYHRNEHGALIRTAISGPQTLDEHGRCCGRKPFVYKRPDLHFFCSRCNREFDVNGIQRANWAFRSVDHGEFVEARPIPMDEVAEHIGDTP